MDIEKAFDVVPRLLLLKQLIKIGIGKCMLHALKCLYLLTTCIITFQGNISDTFQMKRGIRQGAASSVLLFNSYIDGLFNYLKSRCIDEKFLGNTHALIHADDTIVISTNRALFIHKCNETMKFFKERQLPVNFKKSSYLIINPGNNDIRSNLVLDSGVLKYSSFMEYLGVVVSDDGLLTNDVKRYVTRARSNISVKFTNFCNINRNAPLHVKLDILDKCAVPSILYACETWGSNTSVTEVMYRAGIKTALGIRTNINSEIVYLESGSFPLECKIKKAQYVFWAKINEIIQNCPDSALAKILKLGESKNISYITYYKQLSNTYSSASDCLAKYQNMRFLRWKNKIINAADDPDSRLSTYYRVNPTLKPFVPKPQGLMEIERKLLTRYRTGSHSLAIEIGRYSNTPRANRLCTCKCDIQSVWHIFCECPIIKSVLNLRNFESLVDIFQGDNIHEMLMKITSLLKVQI